MCITSPTGHLVRTNGALNAMLGYHPGWLDDKHFKDITHPTDRGVSLDKLSVLNSGDAADQIWEKRYLHRDGSTVWGRLNVSPISNDQGDLLYMVVQVEDITRHKEFEAAAEISQERFRQVFDSAASGMALVNPANGSFMRVNAAGCEMLGYTEDEIMGLTIQDVTAPLDRDMSSERFRQVVTGELDHSRAQLRYLRKNGTTAHGIVSTALVRDSEGNPLHLVANVVDITEQVEARDRLQELVASKDQLIASVSHELRTPLTAVLGFAEVLRDTRQDLSPSERVEVIDSIARQTADLTEIVDDLLVAARARNDTLVVAREPVELSEQIEHVVQAMLHTKPGAHVRIEGPPIEVWGDPARIRQVLRNLLANAFRYGGDDIMVRTYRTGETAYMAVTDNGFGVPPDDLERIFEPYERGAGNVGHTASMGLGLALSRGLARLMGGDLTCRVETGTTVFELALDPVDQRI